jgi:hypothetical protein
VDNFEKAAEELVKVVAIQLDIFRQQLASSLHHLGLFCQKVGNFETGLLTMEEVLSIYRDLAAIQTYSESNWPSH